MERTKMKILVACEESQAVTIAFRERGHEAYSCDIQECSGGHPEWHIQGDVTELLKQHWDMIIAHPPCTYLCNSGVSHLHTKPGRWDLMREAAEFFKLFIDSECDKVCIENPIMHKYAKKIIGVKQAQVIQPYMFGHTEQKATCLWLKGLPLLNQTDNVKSRMMLLPRRERERLHYLPPGPERAKLRSKTYPGIAQAMAEQWG